MNIPPQIREKRKKDQILSFLQRLDDDHDHHKLGRDYIYEQKMLIGLIRLS